jgi:hypothetical protein
MLVLVCKRAEHEIARVYRQPDGRTLLTQYSTRLLTPGERLRLSCPACRAGGRTTDLQLSWARLDAALSEELADTASRSRKLTIG